MILARRTRIQKQYQLKMQTTLEKLVQKKIIPLVAVDSIETISPVCRALISGGFTCIEIAFRSTVAAEAIRRVAQEENILVGAGTVISMDQVKSAIDAGAKFIISPCVKPDIIRYCLENNTLVIPGVSTPTDIGMALDFGLKTLKFFPSEAFGGLNTIKAISPAFRQIDFIPAGGISLNNIREYLHFPKVVACSGSWMVKPESIQQQNFDEIERLCRQTLELIADI